MAPRITIIGGGSYQWAPKLLVDFANTPRAARRGDRARGHRPRAAPAHGRARRAHCEGPRHRPHRDEHHRSARGARGCRLRRRQHLDRRLRFDAPRPRSRRRVTGSSSRSATASDRAASSVRCATFPSSSSSPRNMEEVCPDAWLFNLTNPMTTICRSVTRETSVKTVGLCHEIAGVQFLLSQAARCELHGHDADGRRRQPPPVPHRSSTSRAKTACSNCANCSTATRVPRKTCCATTA